MDILEAVSFELSCKLFNMHLDIHSQYPDVYNDTITLYRE